jgi:hypothetical protein
MKKWPGVSDFKSVGAIGREFKQASIRLNTVLHKRLRENNERWTKGKMDERKFFQKKYA